MSARTKPQHTKIPVILHTLNYKPAKYPLLLADLQSSVVFLVTVKKKKEYMNYVTIVIDVQTLFILLCTIVYESATKLRPIKNEGTRWTYMYHVIIIFIIFQQLWYKHTCTCTWKPWCMKDFILYSYNMICSNLYN